jgi:hypothetical protein
MDVFRSVSARVKALLIATCNKLAFSAARASPPLHTGNVFMVDLPGEDERAAHMATLD